MKIGILTFHHGFNYGCFLQVKALFGHISGLGHDAEIIDYRNPMLERLHERSIRRAWFPWRRRADLKRRSEFQTALAGLRLSPRAQTAKEIDWARYDAVVFGSDEIWNFVSHAHRLDPVFFGCETPPQVKRVAYAPSLGELDGNTPAPGEVGQGLAGFKNIAVRDGNTADFVERITGSRPALVLDPVFLSDFDRALPTAGLDSREVMVYGVISNRPWIRALRRYARGHGFKTVSVGYHNSWCDRNHLTAGPYEFLALLRSARFVVTTTFHGTMFSIKYGIPFVTYRRDGAKKKFAPLVDELGLSFRIREQLPERWEVFEATLGENISSKIDIWADRSKNFLQTALGA